RNDLALDARKIEQRLTADERIHAFDQRRQIALDDEILAFVHERFDRVRNSLAHALDHEPPAIELRILFRAREGEFLLDDLSRQDEPRIIVASLHDVFERRERIEAG